MRRLRANHWLFCLGISALALACQTKTAVAPNDGFAPVSPPLVVVDGSVGGEAGIIAGMGAPHAVDYLDAGPAAKPEVGRTDGIIQGGGMVDVATGECSMIEQNCGAGKGCYLQNRFDPTCMTAGTLGRSTACREHTECEPGHLCVEAFGPGGGRSCQPLCEPGNTSRCAGTGGCKKLNDLPVGYCEP